MDKMLRYCPILWFCLMIWFERGGLTQGKFLTDVGLYPLEILAGDRLQFRFNAGAKKLSIKLILPSFHKIIR